MAKRTASKSVNIKNKRASFDYELLETWTAGIVLTGTEIKSIRDSKASLADTYCTFINGELWVKGMHVAPSEVNVLEGERAHVFLTGHDHTGHPEEDDVGSRHEV